MLSTCAHLPRKSSTSGTSNTRGLWGWGWGWGGGQKGLNTCQADTQQRLDPPLLARLSCRCVISLQNRFVLTQSSGRTDAQWRARIRRDDRADGARGAAEPGTGARLTSQHRGRRIWAKSVLMSFFFQFQIILSNFIKKKV